MVHNWHWRDGDFQEIEGAANIARPSKGTPMIFFAAEAEPGAGADEISIIAKRTYVPAASDPKKQHMTVHNSPSPSFVMQNTQSTACLLALFA